MNIRKNRKGSAQVSTGNLKQDRLIRIELDLLIAMQVHQETIIFIGFFKTSLERFPLESLVKT